MITLRKDTEAVVATTALPRVNLLPVEIREAVHLRQVQTGLGLAVVSAVAAVGLLYVGAAHGVGTAEDRLTAASSERAGLQQQVTGLAGVTRTYERAAAARQMLVQAMGTEVRYSQVFDALAADLPSGVWLTAAEYKSSAAGAATTATSPSTAATTTPGAATSGATPGTTTSGATPGTATSGAARAAAGATAAGPGTTVTLSGHAYTHDDVVALLDRLGALPTLTGVQLASSTEGLIGDRVVTTWSLTAQLTPAAQSGRFPAGG